MSNAAGDRYEIAYVNGVVVPASPYSFSAPHDEFAWIEDISTLQIGARTDNGPPSHAASYYQGEIDELRFWSTKRTQTEIRDNMCVRLAGNETGLIGYYRFDNASGTTLTDLQTNGTKHDGTTHSFAMSGATSNWVVSGAPIGDTSTYSYPGSWAGVQLNLASAAQGSFRVSSVAGTTPPLGMHLYQVNAVPNTSSGVSGLGKNKVYWGTFLTDAGVAPTYRAVLNYSTFPIPAAKEGTLVLNNRSTNATTSWADISATLDQTLNTLTKSGNTSRREFIMSNPGAPLPIELLSFEAECVDSGIDIKWTTASETNNYFFTLESSADALNWKAVKIIPGAGSSTELLNYSVHDSSREGTYYRLMQTDFDGKITYSKNVYQACANEELTSLMVVPNPANTFVRILNLDPNSTLQLVNNVGQILLSINTNDVEATLDISNYLNGTYTLRATSGQRLKNCKLRIAH